MPSLNSIMKCMEVFLRLKDLHAYGKICESVHKTASANKICACKRKKDGAVQIGLFRELFTLHTQQVI